MKIKTDIIVVLALAGFIVLVGADFYLARSANAARAKTRQEEMSQRNPALLEAIQKANDDLREQITHTPDRAPLWFDLGTNKKNIGDYLGAQVALKRATILDRESIISLNNLGAVYEELGEYRKAEEAYREMVNRQKYFEDGYLRLAQLYDSGDYRSKEDAEKILLFGLTVIKDNKALILVLAEYYERNGETEKAEEMYKQLPSATPRPVSQPQTIDVQGGGQFKIEQIQ